MTTAVAKAGDATPTRRGPGRPSKLTPETRALLVGALGKGAPIKTACAVAGVSRAAYSEWIQRGKGEHPDRPATPEYADFVDEVESAIGHGDMSLIGSLRETVAGRQCKACVDGSTVDEKERPIQCPACRGTMMAIKPDGRLALSVLERRHPEFRKPEPTMRVEQHITGSVDINVTALTMDLATMTPAQLAALAGGEERDVIEAEEE